MRAREGRVRTTHRAPSSIPTVLSVLGVGHSRHTSTQPGTRGDRLPPVLTVHGARTSAVRPRAIPRGLLSQGWRPSGCARMRRRARNRPCQRQRSGRSHRRRGGAQSQLQRVAGVLCCATTGKAALECGPRRHWAALFYLARRREEHGPEEEGHAHSHAYRRRQAHSTRRKLRVTRCAKHAHALQRSAMQRNTQRNTQRATRTRGPRADGRRAALRRVRMRRAPCGSTKAACIVNRRAYNGNIRCAAFNVQREACNATYSVQHTMCSMQHTMCSF